MTNVTKDNICELISSDFRDKFGFGFPGESGWKDAILKVCGSGDGQFYPVKLRAMWNIFIGDPKEVEMGIAVSRFLQPRVRARLAVQVHVAQGRVAIGTESHDYICENVLTWPQGCVGYHYAGEWSTWAKGEAPEVHPVPCVRCGGRRLRKGSRMYEDAYKTGMDAYKASPDYIPWGSVGKAVKQVGGEHGQREAIDETGNQRLRDDDREPAGAVGGAAGGERGAEPCAAGGDGGRLATDAGSDEGGGEETAESGGGEPAESVGGLYDDEDVNFF